MITMSTPMGRQANAVLDALQQGQIEGAVAVFRYENPEITNEEIKVKLRQVFVWDDDTLGYWFDWFGLND